ncbi:hypothetical protein F5144DRAFT_592531 [Chaetomium tenue]|uniref:Uncharacterized protein n=1 Tax=Chaetomium tenue TaxID=1854479 RepID=A0ACB7P7V8_9PEZI|nr:hypothetical protein F5144DRAFT_592531 [Chaetomium globosum]
MDEQPYRLGMASVAYCGQPIGNTACCTAQSRRFHHQPYRTLSNPIKPHPGTWDAAACLKSSGDAQPRQPLTIHAEAAAKTRAIRIGPRAQERREEQRGNRRRERVWTPSHRSRHVVTCCVASPTAAFPGEKGDNGEERHNGGSGGARAEQVRPPSSRRTGGAKRGEQGRHGMPRLGAKRDDLAAHSLRGLRPITAPPGIGLTKTNNPQAAPRSQRTTPSEPTNVPSPPRCSLSVPG